MQTEIIAWAGVAIGAFSLAWHVYVHTSNRGRLKVNAVLVTSQNLDTEMSKFEIRCIVTNWGRQPAFLMRIGVDYAGMVWSWGGGDSQLPRRLAPGEWHTLTIDYLGESHGPASDVWAQDSFGRIFRTHRKERKEFVTHAREIEQERQRRKQAGAADEPI